MLNVRKKLQGLGQKVVWGKPWSKVGYKRVYLMSTDLLLSIQSRYYKKLFENINHVGERDLYFIPLQAIENSVSEI